MPQLFRIGPYLVYFWSNENNPVEPVHVHITEGRPSPNATKVWITESGKALLCNDHSKIPQRILVMPFKNYRGKQWLYFANIEKAF